MTPADLFTWQEVAALQAQADAARDRWLEAKARREHARTGMKRRREVELQDAAVEALAAELALQRAESSARRGQH